MKTMVVNRYVVLVASLLLALGARSVLAESNAAQAADPRVVVENVTQELFAHVRAQKAQKASDDVYYKQVQTTLDEVVNFGYIAAHVMGKQAYDKASTDQRKQFLDVFRNGLVKSYAKGIAGYVDSDIKVVNVAADKKNPQRVTVTQEVNDKGTVHKLDYSMVQSRSGDWKLINVTLNGVNLGMSFSSQFKSAMRKYNNDLDKVIANWLSEA